MSSWSVPGYHEMHELGSGGSGRVVMAVELATKRSVAIKYLNDQLASDPRFIAEFRAEARLLQELDSPHIARLHRYVEGSGSAAMVVDLIDGRSLRTVLRQHGATTPEAALAVLKGSLLGLSVAHVAGVIHRDYKPENVLVTREGVSKLIDFGIAAREGSTPVSAGTPMYMAPEQWQGASASPSTDVYAATVTFFECVTGARPFGGDSLAEIASQHLTAAVNVATAPEPVRPLILHGMAKDPRNRPGSAQAFLTELERVAISHYGADWEERGRCALAVVAGLLLPVTGPVGDAADATTSLATTDLGNPDGGTTSAGERTGREDRGPRRQDGTSSRPSTGRRWKGVKHPVRTATLAGSGVLLGVAAVSGILLFDNSAHERAAASPSPVHGQAGATGPGEPTSSSSTEQSSPSASTSASSPTVPVPAFTNADGSSIGGAGAVPIDPGSGGSATPPPPAAPPEVERPPAAEPNTPAPTPSGERPSAPSAPPPVVPPVEAPVAVRSVTISSLRESTRLRGADADLTVTTTNTDPVTLTLTWYNSKLPGNPGMRDGASETYSLRGRTTYNLSYRHAFDECPGYWGLQVTTTPANASGSTYRDMPSPECAVIIPEPR
ncbi:serine/threonine-protein kinase [Streptomyces sp. NPDC127084]|uniref:serine/threonine-protein kinase n=1 Tax=Streptomyces sp. NPDC127084 TaxID=3347133 RepID=UPI00365FFA0C